METFKKIKTLLSSRLKMYSIFALFAVPFFIVSCNLPHKNLGQVSLQEPTEIVIVETPVEKGQQINTDIFELSIEKTLITRAADNVDLGVNISLYEQAENIYFILFGSVKNISTSAIPFSSMLNVELIFDDKYIYDVSLVPSDLLNLVPLKTEAFVWYASVPFEVMNSTSDYKFKWEIKTDTDSNHLNTKYYFTGKNSQYITAENIDNFHVFTEVIELIMADLDLNDKIFVSYSVDEKNKQLIIHPKYDDDFSVPIANGVNSDFGENTIEIHPWLYLEYDKYKRNSTFGEIELQIDLTPHIWALIDSVSLSSGTTSVELNSNPFKMKNPYGGTSQQFFYTNDMSSLITMFENNPTINVGYKNTSSNSSNRIIYGKTNLSGNDKDIIDDLLKVYAECNAILNNKRK